MSSPRQPDAGAAPAASSSSGAPAASSFSGPQPPAQTRRRHDSPSRSRSRSKSRSRSPRRSPRSSRRSRSRSGSRSRSRSHHRRSSRSPSPAAKQPTADASKPVAAEGKEEKKGADDSKKRSTSRRKSRSRSASRDRKRRHDSRSRSSRRRHSRSGSRSRSPRRPRRSPSPRPHRSRSRTPPRFADRFGPPQQHASSASKEHARRRSPSPRRGRYSRSRSRSHSPRRRSPRGEKRRRSPSDSRSRSRSRSRGSHRRSSSRRRSYSPRRRYSRSPKRGRFDHGPPSHAQEPVAPGKLPNASTGEEAYLRRVAASRGAATGGPTGGNVYAHQMHQQAPRPPHHQFSSEPLPPVGSIHQGQVVRLQPFGCFVSFGGLRRHGLVHISRLRSDRRVERVEDEVREGQSVWVKVVGIEGGEKISLSMKDVDQATGKDLNLPQESFGGGSRGGASSSSAELPPLYSIHRATVVKIERFGAFVAYGSETTPGARRPQGLIHISQLSSARRVEDVNEVLSVGEEVWVKVVKIEPSPTGGGGMKVGLSLRDVDQATGKDLDPTHTHASGGGGAGGAGGGRSFGQSSDPPPLHSVHRGRICKIESFGAFVAIDGFRKNGLVHIGQLASYKVDSVDKAVSLDEQVFVKVIRIDEGGAKIALSMKLVDQQSGKDLDPQNVSSSAEEARAQQSRNFDASNSSGGSKGIQLGAVHNVACTRCGANGHLALDCMAPEGVRYDASRDAQEEAAAEQAMVAERQQQMQQTRAKNDSLSQIQQALAIIQKAKDEKKARKEAKRAKKEAKKAKKAKKSSSSKKSKKHSRSKHSGSSGESSSDSDRD